MAEFGQCAQDCAAGEGDGEACRVWARQRSAGRYSVLNEARGNSQRISKGDPLLKRRAEEEVLCGELRAGPREQQSSPSGFLESYLHFIAEKRYDLDDAQSLFLYAAASGQIVSKARISALRRNELTGGVEHEVFLVPGAEGVHRIIKVTRPPNRKHANGYGLNPDVISYLTRLDKMNQLAPNLDYGVVGVTPTLAPERAWPSLVTSMRYIFGTEPTGDELNAWMTKLGFRDQGLNVWGHPLGVTLGDVHTGNFIKTPDGRLVPIDVTIEGNVTLPEISPSA